MAAPTITNTFVAAAPALPGEVNRNFVDVNRALTNGKLDLTVNDVIVQGDAAINGFATGGGGAEWVKLTSYGVALINDVYYRSYLSVVNSSADTTVRVIGRAGSIVNICYASRVYAVMAGASAGKIDISIRKNGVVFLDFPQIAFTLDSGSIAIAPAEYLVATDIFVVPVDYAVGAQAVAADDYFDVVVTVSDQVGLGAWVITLGVGMDVVYD